MWVRMAGGAISHNSHTYSYPHSHLLSHPHIHTYTLVNSLIRNVLTNYTYMVLSFESYVFRLMTIFSSTEHFVDRIFRRQDISLKDNYLFLIFLTVWTKVQMYLIVCFVCLTTMKKCQTVLVYWGCGYEGGRGINDRLTPTSTPALHILTHTYTLTPHPPTHPTTKPSDSIDEVICRRSAVSTKCCVDEVFCRRSPLSTKIFRQKFVDHLPFDEFF
jgi:hypothetical protein